MTYRFALLLIAAAIIAGCTEKIQEPTASVSDVTIKGITSQTLNLDVDVIIDNPNPVGATLTSISFDIYYLKDREPKYLGHGEKSNVEIRKEGKTVITIPVVIDNMQAIRTITEILRKGAVTIKVSGSGLLDLKVTKFEIPFETETEVVFK